MAFRTNFSQYCLMHLYGDGSCDNRLHRDAKEKAAHVVQQALIVIYHPSILATHAQKAAASDGAGAGALELVSCCP